MHPNAAIRSLPQIAAWTELAFRESCDAMPIFLGGDHAIYAGTVAGRAADSGRPLFVLWLDAQEAGLQTVTAFGVFSERPAWPDGMPNCIFEVKRAPCLSSAKQFPSIRFLEEFF